MSNPQRMFLMILRKTNIDFRKDVEFHGVFYEEYQRTLAKDFQHVNQIITDSLDGQFKELLESGDLMFAVSQEFEDRNELIPVNVNFKPKVMS